MIFVIRNRLETNFSRAGELISLALSFDEKKSFAATADLRAIKDCLNGRTGSYQELIKKYQDFVASILWRFTRDRVLHEELIQDVFVQAYLNLGSYAGKAPFEHWLARIATYTGYRFWKRQERKGRYEEFGFEKWDELADDKKVSELESAEAAEILYELLSQLPLRDRLVLTMHYLEGCSMEEISFRMGWSKTMVKVQCWRARNKLKNLFLQSGREITL